VTYGTPDVYYQPEALGVEKVGEFELEEASYSFDTVLVVRDKESGSFYVVHDTGCSCPSPFEDYSTKESLGKPLTAHEAVAEVQRRAAEANAGEAEVDWRPRYIVDPSTVVAAIMAL
jgi:hypothetical protein